MTAVSLRSPGLAVTTLRCARRYTAGMSEAARSRRYKSRSFQKGERST